MTEIPAAASGPLVALIGALRDDWGKPGVTAALAKLNTEPGLTVEQRVLFAIRAAFNSDLRTPEGMNLAVAHRTATADHAPTPYPESRCHHGNRVTACVECIESDHAKTRTPAALAARDRVIAEIRARGKAELHTTPGRLK